MTDQNHQGTDPDATARERVQDDRSDIEQVVRSRDDAVARGEGGQEPDRLTDPGMHDGVGGTGGVVKNQNSDAQ